MADDITKKEHYVPQCYLRNFAIAGNPEKIHVFDKTKAQTRRKQNILDNAQERYFYDIDIDRILDEASEENRTAIIKQLGDDYDMLRNDKTQYIEKLFGKELEGNYSQLLKNIIDKACNATPWYVSNCYCMSEEQKIAFSVYLSIQYLRTRKTRNMIEEGYTKLYETLFRKIYNQKCEDDELKLDPGDVTFSIGEEALKIPHAEMLLNMDATLDLSVAFLNHIWVIYINNTKIPFWTSDSPVVLNNTPSGGMANKGITSRRIEIYFPLNGKVCLALYDREAYEMAFVLKTSFEDRFYLQASEEIVERCNMIQVKECNRCVYAEIDDFSVAEKMCRDYPTLMQKKKYFDVG